MNFLEKYKKEQKEKLQKVTAIVVGASGGGLAYLAQQSVSNSLAVGGFVGLTAYFAYKNGVFKEKFEQLATIMTQKKEKELRKEINKETIEIIKNIRTKSKLTTNEKELAIELDKLLFDELLELFNQLEEQGKKQTLIQKIKENKYLMDILTFNDTK